MVDHKQDSSLQGLSKLQSDKIHNLKRALKNITWLSPQEEIQKAKDGLLKKINEQEQTCKTDAEFQKFFCDLLNGGSLIKQPQQQIIRSLLDAKVAKELLKVISATSEDERELIERLQKKQVEFETDAQFKRYLRSELYSQIVKDILSLDANAAKRYFDADHVSNGLSKDERDFIEKLQKKRADFETHEQFKQYLRFKLSYSQILLATCPKKVITEVLHPYHYVSMEESFWQKYLFAPLTWLFMPLAFIATIPVFAVDQIIINPFQVMFLNKPARPANIFSGVVSFILTKIRLPAIFEDIFKTPWSKVNNGLRFLKIIAVIPRMIGFLLAAMGGVLLTAFNAIVCGLLSVYAALNFIKFIAPYSMRPLPYIFAAPILAVWQFIEVLKNLAKKNWKEAGRAFIEILRMPIVSIFLAVVTLIHWFLPIPNSVIEQSKAWLKQNILILFSKKSSEQDQSSFISKTDVDDYFEGSFFKGEYVLRKIMFPLDESEVENDKVIVTIDESKDQMDEAMVKTNESKQIDQPKEQDVKTTIVNDYYSIDIGCIGPDNKSLLSFNGNGETCQGMSSILTKMHQDWKCHVRGFNYPAIFTEYKKDHAVKGAINAGIKQLYDIAQKKGLSFLNSEDHAKIVNQCILYGHSLGGGIALQVAAFFKKQYGIDLKVCVDRSFESFASAMAGHLNNNILTPFWCGKGLSRLLLYAAGDLNIDSMKAYKQLEPQSVYYFNISGDSVILDDASLTAAIHDKSCGFRNGNILRKLKEKGSAHVMFMQPENENFVSKHSESITSHVMGCGTIFSQGKKQEIPEPESGAMSTYDTVRCWAGFQD